jgi:hypothetical protein
LNLVDFQIAAHGMGSAAVDLRIEDPSSPIFAGYRGSWDSQGGWRERLVSAMYWADSSEGSHGGLALRPGNNLKVLASYEHVYEVPGFANVLDANQLTRPGENAAIVAAPYGNGQVTIFCVEPAFRGHWLNTFCLVSNALLASILP